MTPKAASASAYVFLHVCTPFHVGFSGSLAITCPTTLSGQSHICLISRNIFEFEEKHLREIIESRPHDDRE